MSNRLRPMRGSIAERDKLVFPYMASPKYDGVRCFIQAGVAYSKSGKPIPNRFIQRALATYSNGLDGELICGDPTDPLCYRKTTGAVRRVEGQPEDLRFYVFDVIPSGEKDTGWEAAGRYGNVEAWVKHWQQVNAERGPKEGLRPKAGDFSAAYLAHLVPMTIVNNHQELDEYEAQCLAEGYEGVMLRHPESPYKHGQATVRENYLLKLKRFVDGEAEITGFVEFQHNDNVPFTDEQGFTKRSHAKAGKRKGDKLGKLLAVGINGPHKGKAFEVGTGFTDAERKDLWARREQIVGEIFTFRCQEASGGYELPRIPTFQGFRMQEDLVPDDETL